MRRSNKQVLEGMKKNRVEEDKKPLIKIDLNKLDEISLDKYYTADLVTTLANFLGRSNRVEPSQLHVLGTGRVPQLETILKNCKFQNLSQKWMFFLLELDGSERRWTTLVITAEDTIHAVYKDPTGGKEDDISAILNKVFPEGFQFINNLEGTYRPNDSGVVSLTWMRIIMEGLQSSDYHKFISEYPKLGLSMRVRGLKTDLKVDMVDATVRQMLGQVEITPETTTMIRTCIELCKSAQHTLGEPVTLYQKVLKEEMEKMEADPDYEMDQELITNAQTQVTGKLGDVDMVRMEEFIKNVTSETEKEIDEHGVKILKKKKSPVTVFKECVRLLKGAEETDKLRKLLNTIGNKYGVEENKLIEYFKALPDEESTGEKEDKASGENMNDLAAKLPSFSKKSAVDPTLKSLVQLLAEIAEGKQIEDVEENEKEWLQQKYIGNEEVVEMEKDYHAIMGYFEKWKDADAHAINFWAIENRGHLESWVEGVAVLDRVFQLTTGGFRLRVSQMLSVIWFLRQSSAGKLAEISTGEGKTVIIAFVASIKVLQNNVVDVLTSNEVLAQEGAVEMKTFYQMLGITVSTNNVEIVENDSTQKEKNYGEPQSKACYSADIVYGTITNFQFDYLRHTSEAQMTRGERPFGLVILDEVDNLSVDNGGNIAKLAKPFPGMECLKYVYIKIWQELAKAEVAIAKDYTSKMEAKEKELLERDSQHGTMDDLSISPEEKYEYENFRAGLIANYVEELRTRIKASDPIGHTGDMIHHHLREYSRSMLDKWIDNALYAKFECKENEMYIVKQVEGEDAVVPVDYANTGVTMENTQWSNGLHQFVQLKHNLRITCESLTSSFISNLGFIKLYESRNIFGLTGTLGSTAEKEMLRAAYNVTFTVIPRYKKNKLVMTKGLVVEDPHWANLVSIEAVIEAVVKNRAVLIICKTIRELTVIKENVAACLKLEGHQNVKLKEYIDEDGSMVVREKVGPREIIVATNIAGRGTNFKTTKELETAGGLHVVISFLPYNQRVQDQAVGRTARQGNNGTAQLILKRSDVTDIDLEVDGEEILTMEAILEKRDALERARLGKIQEQKLMVIDFNDKLFSKVSTLYAEFNNKFGEKVGASFVAADLKEYWAFWLHKQDYDFDKIKITNPEAEFARFSTDAVGLTDRCEVIWNPFNEIRRGERFLQMRETDEAEKAVKHGIEMCGGDLCASGHFQMFEVEIEKGAQLMERFKKALASLIFIPVKKDETYKEKAKDALVKTVASLEKELNYVKTNFTDENTNGDFQLILMKPETNFMLKHLNGRFTALSVFHQHAQSLLKRLEESVDSETTGVAVGSRIPHYLKKLEDKSSDEKKLKESLTKEELSELQAIGLVTIYSLRDVHDAHKETIIGAQIQIGAGLASLVAGIIFPPALPVLGPIAGALISEGVCDIVIELLSRGQAGFDVKSYVKGKCISFGIALATMGISAIATSVKLLSKAANACKALANLLRKCPYLKGVCTKLAGQLDKLGKYFEKLKIIAQFGKMKDIDKLEMLRKLKATGEVEKLKNLGGLAQLRQLEHLQSVGKLGLISKSQLLTSAVISIGKQTFQSVTMSLITEHLVTAGLNRILEGLRPMIETRVREGLQKENLKDNMRKIKNQKEVEIIVMSVLEGSWGEIATDVLKDIALGVVRHSSNWKLKLTSLAVDAALSLSKISSYTSSFSEKFKNALEERVKEGKEEGEKDEAEDNHLESQEKVEVVVSLVTDKVYRLIMELAGKTASTLVVAPLMSKLMGAMSGKKAPKNEINEEDEHMLSQIANAYEALKLSPGATPEEVKKAYRKACLQTHPDKGGSRMEFDKVQNAYELITKLNKDWTNPTPTGSNTTGGIQSLTGPTISGVQPEVEKINETGDGGNIATISSQLQQSIVVKSFDKNGLVVKEKEYGAKYKENGKPSAVIGYIPRTAQGGSVGHFFEMKGDQQAPLNISSLASTSKENNNCLYESLAPQINGGALTVQELREVAERHSLANTKYAIGHLAVSLLNNPVTSKLYEKARGALLVGGSLEDIQKARAVRDNYVNVLKEMSLQAPEIEETTFEKACKGNQKAMDAIINASKKQELKPDSRINVHKISGVDNLISFIINFPTDDGPPYDPFVLEYSNGVRSVVGGNLYSLVAIQGEEVHVANNQYKGVGGTLYSGMMALVNPDTKLNTEDYPELSGRLISEAIRNKSTLLTYCLAMVCEGYIIPICGSTDPQNTPHYVSNTTGIRWEENAHEDYKNTDFLLSRYAQTVSKFPEYKNLVKDAIKNHPGLDPKIAVQQELYKRFRDMLQPEEE